MGSTAPWMLFCACAGCELIAGFVYAFGLFSDVLRNKTGLALSQTDVEAVAVAENLGQYFRLFGGLLFDHCHVRITLVLGLLLNSFGYFGLYMAVRASESCTAASQDKACWQAPLAMLCSCSFIYGQGAGWMEVSVVSTAVAAFPAHRGEAVGLLKTFFGIAAAIAALTFAAVFSPSRESLLLFFAVCPIILGLPLAMLMHPQIFDNPPNIASASDGPWRCAYFIAFVLVATLITHSLLATFPNTLRPYESHRVSNLAVFGCVLGLLVALPFLQRFRHAANDKPRPQEHDHVKRNQNPSSTLSDDDFPLFLRRLRFWLLFFALAAGEGAGLMVLNNMGQLVRSLDNGSSELQNVCVAMFSVMNAVGRLATGKAVSLKFFGTTQFLVLALGGTSLSYFLFAASGRRSALLLAMPVIGFGYGCLWSLMPLLTSELIGERSYGSKYAMIAFSAVVGSAPLSRIVVPYYYEKYADGSGWCVGPECFRGSLFCAAAFCLTGAMLALCIGWTSGRGVSSWQGVISSEQEEVGDTLALSSVECAGVQESDQYEQHSIPPQLLGHRSSR